MKILYISHTNWNSIKQRSHFLAENLNSKRREIHVSYKWSPKRYNYSKNKTFLKLIPCLFAPFSLLKFKLIFLFDTFFWRIIFNFLDNIYNYKYVIVTHPLLYRYTTKMKSKIIFDCCDDNELFYKKSKLKDLIRAENLKFLSNSNLNIFSSENLLNKYEKDKKKNLLVRNAHSLNLIGKRNLKKTLKKKSSAIFNIFYFGTVSNWFDNKLIKSILREIDNVKFTIIGPVDSRKIKDERVDYIGPMKHGNLLKFSNKADAFIMPFIVNELIKSVDPVKLYEYLSFKVPVISIYYPEIKYFNGLVDFYSNQKEAIILVKKLITKKKVNYNNLKKRHKFLIKNTWKYRSNQIANALQKL